MRGPTAETSTAAAEMGTTATGMPTAAGVPASTAVSSSPPGLHGAGRQSEDGQDDRGISDRPHHWHLGATHGGSPERGGFALLD
jgi:hypothetical protein